MFAIFQEEKWITAIMFAFLVLSIAFRIMIGVLYQHMIKETENMSATGNKILKQCKLKFANCYQLNNGVANIPVFVDKFLGKLKIGPFSYQTIYHLSGQFVLLSVFFAGVGVCKGIIDGRSLGEVLPFYIVSFLGLYIYFSISGIVDAKGRRRLLKTNLVDYLENHMVNRLRNGAFEEERTGRRNREGRTGIEVLPVHGTASAKDDGVAAYQSVPVKADKDKKATGISSAGDGEERIPGQAAGLLNRLQEKELEELLKEFLTS
ncbi:MAG: hypothetical protein ACI4EQ_09705 [Lachnospiraceae bacterium]